VQEIEDWISARMVLLHVLVMTRGNVNTIMHWPVQYLAF